MSQPPVDQAVREQALSSQHSFAVTAPAGSGKTGLLTKRALKLLSICNHPEEVLCITFTRKAAAEMHERIHAALTQAATSQEPESPNDKHTWQLAKEALKRDKALEWNLLQNPNRLRIQTIDGLCRSITQQLPLASGLGAQPQTLDAPQDAYRLAVRELLRTLKNDSDNQQDLALLLTHLDNNIASIETLLTTLLARREQWLGLLLQARQDEAKPYFEHVLNSIIAEHLEKTLRQLQPWQSDLALLADYAGENVSQSTPDAAIAQLKGVCALPPAKPEYINQWLAFTELCLAKKGDWRKKLTKNEGFIAGTSKDEKALAKEKKQAFLQLLSELSEKEGLLEHLQGIRHLPKDHYSDSQWQLVNSLTRLLPQLIAHLKLTFKQLSATDFSEVNQAALLALGDDDSPTDIALQLDYQIQHIMVDEFQDTSSPQLELLKALTAGWTSQDGRTLFIVGDGMQSCYGFRDANVGIFLDARKHGIGAIPLTPLDLQVNFRSQQGVVDWVNETFSTAFPAENNIGRGAVNYSPSIAFNPPLPEQAVKCYACINDHEHQSETRQVIDIIQTTLAQKPDNRIAILVRNRPHLLHILQAMEAANLPWQANDIHPLAERMAIIDLLSLTRALHDLSDRLSWFAILRAPWCGLTLDDLLIIAKAHDEEHSPAVIHQLRSPTVIEQLSPDGKARLSRFMYSIEPALAQQRRKPLRAWIHGTWLALGGPATLLDISDLDNTTCFFELLDSVDKGSQVHDWPAFEYAIEKLYAAPSNHPDQRIQVMTIHKAKGLEFDTVIIPGLDRRQPADTQQLLLWLERLSDSGERQLLLSPVSASGEEHDHIYQYIANEQKIKNQLEATRLLYVGCTRAIKQLHLLANVTLDEKTQQYKSPGNNSLLNSIWPTFKAQASEVANSYTSTTEEQALPPLNHLMRFDSSWQQPHLKTHKLLDGYKIKPTGILDDIDNPLNQAQRETASQYNARITGTVLHQVLEQITQEGFESWDGDYIQSQIPFWELLLSQHGLPKEDQHQAISKIHTAIITMLNDPTGRWILDNKWQDSQCELSIFHRNGAGVTHSIIDRAFIYNNTRWVIDYKSSEPEPGQSLDAFIAQEIEHYREQLKRYQQAIQALDNTSGTLYPIQTALYFPLIQQLCPIEHE